MQGLLLINKPCGKTSFSAVSAIKKLACEKRVGHTGTLDPLAIGVLPILLGRATALSSFMLDADKRYIAKIRLGIVTDTDDITGNIIREKKINATSENIISALKHFTGKLSQTPPLYSAIKQNGVRLYTLAREGKSVDIPAREIEVFSISLLSGLNDKNEFEIETLVSKGTYIRSLARDLGEYLGCGATLVGLCRTYASGFNLEECIDLKALTNKNISEHILSEEKCVLHLPEITISQKQAIRFCNGGQLSFDRLKKTNFKNGQLFRIKYEKEFLGIGFADCEHSQIGIKCIINYPKGEIK